jgi:YVTN family beta-propeller protein
MRAGAVGALGAAAALAVAVYAWPAGDTTGEGPRPAGHATPDLGAVTIAVGEKPVEVAVGHGAIWVANTADDSVTRIDPDTNAVQATVLLEGAPGDLAVDWAGHLWVAIPEAGVVQRLDSTTDALTPNMRVEVAAPGTPLDLAVQDHLWVSVVEEALVKVDVESGAILNRNEELRPVNVAARDGGVFALEPGGVVRGIDPDTGAASTLSIPFDVEGRGDVHFHGTHLWVAEGDGSTLFAAPLGAPGTIERYSFRGTYMEMVHGPEGTFVLSDLGDGTALLSVIDPGGTVREVAELPGGPRDLVGGAEDLWVSNSAAATVTRLADVP